MAHPKTIAEALACDGSGRLPLTSHEQVRQAEEHDECDSGSITKRYHRLRAEELSGFVHSLKDNEEDKFKLKMDARRVKRCRTKLAESKKTRVLFDEVHESFHQWRSEADGRPDVQFRWSANERNSHFKDLDFLDEDDIDADGGATEDAGPEHDFIAGFLFFQKDIIGWKKATYHGLGFNKHEEFPNQKMTVHEALFGKEHNPFSETEDEGGGRHLKYIHLPANHMGWVDQAIARYYREDVEPRRDQRKMTNQTLAREFWRGQVHGGGLDKHPIHARHLRSRCFSISLDAGSNASTGGSFHFRKSEPRRKSFAIFLPYLHWEMYCRKARMAETVQEIIEGRKRAPISAGGIVKHTKNDDLMKLKEKNRKKFGMTVPKHELTDNIENIVRETVNFLRFKRKTKLGTYLLKVAKLWEAMEAEAEERLLRHGLVPQQIDAERPREPPLHIRRTLDQSYFLNLEDTSRRDRDQVVYRATKLPWHIHGNLTRVVMVDQLWLWILDDYTIISAFPKRWGRNKPDSSGIHKSLREKLNRMNGEITSVWHLASIIIDQCSRVFFDRTKPLDLRPEVMDMFAESLNNVNEHITNAFEVFWSQAELEERGKRRPSPRYLYINPEGILLREAQDIVEELRMMTRIYAQQLGAVEDFRKSLHRWNKQRWEENQGNTKHSTNDTQDPSMDFEFIEEMTEHIRSRKAEIEELAGAAERSCQNLQGLLALKQQQASIVEAKAALERADHGVEQQQLSIELAQYGQQQAKMSNKLSKQSYEQGKSIMAFTIMTIIFTPLGFFTSFFGMNNSSTGEDWMSLWEQSLVMLGISAVIIFIFLAVAFRKVFRDPLERLMGREKTHTVEEGLQHITNVARLEQLIETTPRGSADEIAIRRLQQEHESLKGRATTFRNPHRAGTLTPVQSRTERHGNSRRTG